MSEITQRYISNELVHFIGRYLPIEEQIDLLFHIIDHGHISHPPHEPRIIGNLTININAKLGNNEMYAPEITCFADIPIHDLSLHMEKYSRVGLSFTKDFVARQGGSPVHYLAKETKVRRFREPQIGEHMSSQVEVGQAEWRDQLSYEINKSDYYDEMIGIYHEIFDLFLEKSLSDNETPGVSPTTLKIIELKKFFGFHVFSYLKFFDHQLTDDHQDNYYFEREWRIVGNLQFGLSDIQSIFLPRSYSSQLRKRVPDYCGQVIFSD